MALRDKCSSTGWGPEAPRESFMESAEMLCTPMTIADEKANGGWLPKDMPSGGDPGPKQVSGNRGQGG